MQQSGDRESITIRFDTESEKNQVLILMEALEIFAVKNAEYNDAWSKYGSYGAAFFMLDRAERVWQSVTTNTKFKTEDALDLINLCAFAIRSQNKGNIGGQRWPQMNEGPDYGYIHAKAEPKNHPSSIPVHE